MTWLVKYLGAFSGLLFLTWTLWNDVALIRIYRDRGWRRSASRQVVCAAVKVALAGAVLVIWFMACAAMEAS